MREITTPGGALSGYSRNDDGADFFLPGEGLGPEERDEPGAVAHAKFFVDILQVISSGMVTDEEEAGDFPGAPAFDDEIADFPFPRRQAGFGLDTERFSPGGLCRRDFQEPLLHPSLAIGVQRRKSELQKALLWTVEKNFLFAQGFRVGKSLEVSAQFLSDDLRNFITSLDRECFPEGLIVKLDQKISGQQGHGAR